MRITQTFVNAREIERCEPAGPEQLAAFEARSGLTLPAAARELYLASNGLAIPRLRLRFVSLAEVPRYLEGFRDWPVTERFGYFPFTEANDSDPYCVCCKGVLTGRVVHVCHDDAPGLDFRDLGSFLAAVLKLAHDAPGSLIDALPAQYDNTADRKSGDEAAGLELLRQAAAMSREEPDRELTFGFGMRLLSDERTAEFTKLLEDSRAVRGYALHRLKRIATPEAREAVSRHMREWEQFRAAAVDALRRASIRIDEVRDDGVLLQPGPYCLSLGAFYELRSDPDILDQIVAEARHLVTEGGT